MEKKILKNCLNKWKMKCLVIKIKNDLIIENNERKNNFKYQRRIRFSYEGIKRIDDKIKEKEEKLEKLDEIKINK